MITNEELRAYVLNWVKLSQEDEQERFPVQSAAQTAKSISEALRDANTITPSELVETRRQAKAILLNTGLYRPIGTNNPNGRPRGAKNKSSAGTKAWLQSVLEQHRDELTESFAELSPKEKWRVALNIAQFIVPKQTAVAAKIDLETLTESDLNELISKL